MEPLASQIRPDSLADFIGQSHLVDEGRPLRQAIEKGVPYSFLLWGPAGCGKTTLAYIYANSLEANFHELSAVAARKSDLRDVVADAEETDGPTVLFLDEIHRFNKAQQDYLLPYVEDGTLILVGATTENPSFEVIDPLLSRMRVFEMEPLTDDEMRTVVERTDLDLSNEAVDWVVDFASGDARRAINLLDEARKLYDDPSTDNLDEVAQTRMRKYDKEGEKHYNLASAYIKSMRASQTSAALYYLARMIEGGEDPIFIARRLVIFASEDIGLAQPTALVVANAAFRAVETVGLPEARINLASATAYLSRASKDRSAYDAYGLAEKAVEKYGDLPVPKVIRNAPTELMKRKGYGEDYELYPDEDLLPDELQGTRFLKEDNNEG